MRSDQAWRPTGNGDMGGNGGAKDGVAEGGSTPWSDRGEAEEGLWW